MEQKLLFLINREWTNPALDKFMAVMSSFDFWTIPLIVIAAGSLLLGGFRARTMLVVLGLLVAFSESIISGTLKKTVARPRPNEVLADVRVVDLQRARPRFLALARPLHVELSHPELQHPGGRSFPSSHTVDNFCAAVVLTYFYRRFGWLYFPVAAAIGYSRIYVGSHWPSDVAISAFLGAGIALVLLPLCEIGWTRLGARFWPRLVSRHATLAGI